MAKVLLYTLGALCVGGGVLTAVLGGFAVADEPAALTFSTLGYDAVADIGLTESGIYAVTLFISGISMLIAANASAWKQTGGY